VQADSGSHSVSASWRQSAQRMSFVGGAIQTESDGLPEWFPHSCYDSRNRSRKLNLTALYAYPNNGYTNASQCYVICALRVLLDETALKLWTQRQLYGQSMSVWGGSSMLPFTLLAEDSQRAQPWVPKTKRPLDPVTWTTPHTADDAQGKCQEAQSRQQAEPKAGTERSQGTGPRQRVHFWSSDVHVRAEKHEHRSTPSYLS
jgi:hypothetical protein